MTQAETTMPPIDAGPAWPVVRRTRGEAFLSSPRGLQRHLTEILRRTEAFTQRWRL